MHAHWQSRAFSSAAHKGTQQTRSVTYVDERPGKLVQVLVDGTWYDGELEAWRRTDGRWRGYVRWSVGVGMRHLGWVDQEQLRP